MYVRVVVYDVDDSVIANYVMDYNNQGQRKTLAMQSAEALRHGQEVVTHRVERDGSRWMGDVNAA